MTSKLLACLCSHWFSAHRGCPGSLCRPSCCRWSWSCSESVRHFWLGMQGHTDVEVWWFFCLWIMYRPMSWQPWAAGGQIALFILLKWKLWFFSWVPVSDWSECNLGKWLFCGFIFYFYAYLVLLVTLAILFMQISSDNAFCKDEFDISMLISSFYFSGKLKQRSWHDAFMILMCVSSQR